MFAGPIPPTRRRCWIRRDETMIRDAHRRYDLVVIDTPPLSVVPDAVPLLGQLSAVLTVGRINGTTRDAVVDLIFKLTILDAPLVGVVANKAVENGTDTTLEDHARHPVDNLRKASE